MEQTVRFTSAFYPDWQQATADKILREFELPLNRKVKALSKGMRTKLALLLAFARRPELLILDEPSEGLDPVAIELVLQLMVAQAAQGTAVFFSSHQISEVERICDQVCILDKGTLLLDSSLERVQINGRQISIFASGNAAEVIERARAFRVARVGGWRSLFRASSRWRRCRGRPDIGSWLSIVHRRG